jgi:hypothetical protein
MSASEGAPVDNQYGVGAGTELLYESERTRVTRLLPAGGGPTIIRKEPLGADAQKRLRHELEILGRLAGVIGVAQLAVAQPLPGSILLEDVHGEELSRRAMPLEPTELTRLALDLARALAGMHRRGVVHRDINPANVVLSSFDGAPILVGFGLATTFAELRPGFTHYNEIVGTLAYLAPEQTGRTSRPVDQRADLYGLGATLYELATGTPPFGTGYPLRLSHDHLARLPTPLAQVNRAVAPELSSIIMRLLEKEPDSRYQTAQGLVYDLAQLTEGRPVRVGARDFPLRLVPPSRLIGRDADIAALGSAFAGALEGQCRGVLVSGAHGVGKTSLINELRATVTASDGWFVAGKFDQHRQEQEFHAVRQAFHALGRLLLAEPDDEVAKIRAHILRAIGPHAGIVSAVLPEFALLLGVTPEPPTGDPVKAHAREQRIKLELLRAIASPKRPLVMVVDDLQWAGLTAIRFVDAVLSDEELEGVLLVGAYREDEIDTTHPLSAMLPRWQQLSLPPTRIRLSNLSTTSLTTLLADMLRLRVTEAAALAEAIEPRTRGNPYTTVELVNALRHDGVLMPGPDGWWWDPQALQRHLVGADVTNSLVGRISAMPPETQGLLETMACLGGHVGLSLLEAATGLSPTVMEGRLWPAVEDGLLVLEPGGEDSVRFRHDRVREAVLGQLMPTREHELRLCLARRLATQPEVVAVAAEQFLRVLDAVRDADERLRVIDVFRRAADQALLSSNHLAVERFLAAALELVDPAETASVIELETDHHAALYRLGRLDEADEAYRTVDRLCSSPLQRTDATLVQVSSLTNRGRPREALTLGVDLLRQFGVDVPSPDNLGVEIERDLEVLYRWVDEGDAATDLRRPEARHPFPLAKAALVNRLMAPAAFCDLPMRNWLALEAARIWAAYGPARNLVGPLSNVAFAVGALRHDYRTGRLAMRRILAVSEARAYEPETSQVRFLYALCTGHWFGPLEENVSLAHRAREGLIHGGDPQNACHTYHVSVKQFFEYAPSLESYISEVESALELAASTGNEYAADSFRTFRRVAYTLRGEASDSPEDEAAALDRLVDDWLSPASINVSRALTAALFNDSAGLVEHSTAAMRLLPFIEPAYSTLFVHLLQALALAGRVRAAAPAERTTLLAELDMSLEWLASRAEDAPGNFLHLLRLVEAERAWALDNYAAAAYAFDAAQREVATQQRPWHRALIIERAARFQLAYGMEHIGHTLLSEARQAYHAWGAAAKVAQLDHAYPNLRAEWEPPSVRDVSTPPASIVTGAIDVLGILDASQALSSETNIHKLRARVVDVLSTMTGATAVHLVVWDDGERRWLLPALDSGEGGTMPIDEARGNRLVPLSAIRYVERTREPLVVTDATRDDRFARDPYLAGLDCCSLLVVPILSRGPAGVGEPPYPGCVLCQASRRRDAHCRTARGLPRQCAGVRVAGAQGGRAHGSARGG